MLAHPAAPARVASKRVTIEEVGRETVIAHNDPSPARDRVLRLYERRHAPINIQVALPSLDGIKRAVEMGLGVAVLPRRCALAELARGRLVAVKVPELSAPRSRAARVPAVRGAVARGRGVPGAGASGTDGTEAADKTTQQKNGDGSVELERVERLSAPVRRREALAPARDVRQPLRHRLDLLEPIEQQAGRVPRAVEERLAGRRRQRDRRICRPGSVTLDALEIDHAARVGGIRFDGCHQRGRASPASAVTHGMPSATELPKKISENDSPTTARMPLRRIACGACSRDEPHPKFAFTSRIDAPA